jgi:hypothetical protein
VEINLQSGGAFKGKNDGGETTNSLELALFNASQQDSCIKHPASRIEQLAPEPNERIAQTDRRKRSQKRIAVS